jgi:hypothetical protein
LIATVVVRGVSGRKADIANSRNLIPASGDQDHTPLPSEGCITRQRCRLRPSHPAARFVTIAKRPSVRETPDSVHLICPTVQVDKMGQAGRRR